MKDYSSEVFSGHAWDIVHKLSEGVTGCKNLVRDQVKIPLLLRGGTHEVLLLAEELLAIGDCWGAGQSVFFRNLFPWSSVCPTPKYILATLYVLSEVWSNTQRWKTKEVWGYRRRWGAGGLKVDLILKNVFTFIHKILKQILKQEIYLKTRETDKHIYFM